MTLTSNELAFIAQLHHEAFMLNGRKQLPYPPEIVDMARAATKGWQKDSTAYKLMLAKVRELGLIT
jgi:hypothetical protein